MAKTERVIKFRAYHSATKTMSYRVGIDIDGEMLFQYPNDERVFHYGDKSNLMQFTGLHDKNGKEIYEGDILLTDEAGWKAPVVWRRDMWVLELNIPLVDGGGFSYEVNWEACEVIGNIHENPELLTKGN